MTPLAIARRGWRRLTSMRTALILLFLLAVAAVPGSLLPQRPLNPTKTKNYIADHGDWGRFLDEIGMFDVFGSVWFAAIYLLLFVSLVGCLIPRIRVYARSVARKPLPAPRHLTKLPESTRYEIAGAPAAYAPAARQVLGRRWRVVERTEDSGAVTLSAEKGYTREFGNLLFHVALLATLLLIAVGRLWSYEGSVIVRQGTGFCNTSGQYDDWKPGRLAAEGRVAPAPFCIDDLTKFTAKFGPNGEPRDFQADVVYADTADADAATHRTSITVNHPLRLEGDRVYLINHGFAPTVTIRMPNGQVVHQTANFLATNSTTLYSEGIFTGHGPDGAKQDVGIRAFFAPNAALGADGLTTSISPDTKNPQLGLQVFLGDLNETGEPHSIYTFDDTKMKQIGKMVTLKIGETQSFGNGVEVTYDGWVPWASLQVSHDPAQSYLLLSALAMVIGLGFSLGVRRRRLWLRITPDAGAAAAPRDGSLTVVTVGGLARSDSGNFTTEFAALVERLQEAGAAAGSPEEISDADDVAAMSASRKD